MSNSATGGPNISTPQSGQNESSNQSSNPSSNESSNQSSNQAANQQGGGQSTPPAPPDPPAPPANQKTTGDIQKMSGWQWCTAQVNGQPCASGMGNADSSMTANQPAPSLSGGSSVFWIAGPTAYSNALWWKELAPDSASTHFNYDLYFYLEDSNAPEALEFDVNQTISGTRYVWGTECSYRNTGYWQIWDSAGNKWFNTDVPCHPVEPKKWHHLVWQFERIANKVHYIGVTLDGNYTFVDKYFDPQQYGSSGLSVAFQLDGDYRQTPYKVWLDNVSLISW